MNGRVIRSDARLYLRTRLRAARYSPCIALQNHSLATACFLLSDYQVSCELSTELEGLGTFQQQSILAHTCIVLFQRLQGVTHWHKA